MNQCMKLGNLLQSKGKPRETAGCCIIMYIDKAVLGLSLFLYHQTSESYRSNKHDHLPLTAELVIQNDAYR